MARLPGDLAPGARNRTRVLLREVPLPRHHLSMLSEDPNRVVFAAEFPAPRRDSPGTLYRCGVLFDLHAGPGSSWIASRSACR